MAGMVHDANQSLKWIMNDPEITEAFLNSSAYLTTSTSVNSPTNSVKESTATRPFANARDKNNNGENTNLNREKDNKELSKHSSFASLKKQNSYASLFSDEEERDLLGIGFFTVWEAGILISGYVGTGILLSRNIVTGSWSAPVAVGISGVGGGLIAGVSARSLVYLIYDYFTLHSIIGTDTGGMIFGIGAGATIGSRKIGPGATYITSPKTYQSAGLGSNVTLSRGLGGLFVGASIEGGVCRTRDRLNARFYGRDNLTGSDILLSGEDIEIPDDNGKNRDAKRMMEKVHQKLMRLCSRDKNAINFNYNCNIGLDIDNINDVNNGSNDCEGILRDPIHTPHDRNESNTFISSVHIKMAPDAVPAESESGTGGDASTPARPFDTETIRLDHEC